MVIDAEFGKENHNLIPDNYNWEGAELLDVRIDSELD
jgi:hypothetical protein